jgi:hypothetical protein
MSLTLTLPPQLAERLQAEAALRGVSAEEYALRLLDERLPQVWNEERRAAAIAMLKQWAEEDAQMSDEERASNAEVLRAIDEHRPHRKLFTETLKDVP